MSDFEKIEIDPATAEVRFERSDFAQVVFHNISETYTTDANIECCYTITTNLVPTAKDWIGLYRVGWKSSHDYIYFHWSPMPANEPGDAVENKVVFQAHVLPKEDGEFYQFCYVTSANQVRGASTPFQFKRPSSDDFIEVEDEEGDMMVIKTKTIALQDDLSTALKEKEELTKRIGLLEQERDSLLDKLVDYNKMLHGEKIERDQLQKQLKHGSEKLTFIETEVKDMSLLNEGLREKITFLSQEKESILKRLDENERYITSMQEKIKVLLNEKDALTGRNKSLEQEKELFKNHFTSSEGTIQGYMKEIDRLKVELRTQEEASAQHAANTCKFRSDLADLNKKLERQMIVSKADKDHIDAIREKLRNSEDKLSAAEHCKTLLNDEVTAVQQAHQKMSQDLEKSKMECDTWRQRLASLETKNAESEKLWNQEKVHMQRQLEQKETEIAQELNQIREQLQTSEERHNADKDGSLFALQTAQAHLKERYSRMKKENTELHKQITEFSQKQKKWENSERDLHREIEDLKERLSMGADEYKIRYLESRKLQSEIKKLQKQLKRSQTPEKCVESTSTETERVRRNSVGSGTERVQHSSVAMETVRVVNTSVGMETERVTNASVALETERVINASVALETERVTNSHVSTGTEIVSNNSVAMETERVTNSHVSTGTESFSNNSVGLETERILTAEIDTNTPDEEKLQACAQTEDDYGSIADLTNTELQCQLEDLGRELQQRYSKKQKYKQMYMDEKEKNSFLQKHYFEEISAKDGVIEHKDREIRRLQKMIRILNVKFTFNTAEKLESDSDECRLKEVVAGMDPLQTEEEPPVELEKPLTPLPAPMIPEVLPSAKVAAVMSVVSPPVRGSEMNEEDLMRRSSTAVITAQPRASGVPTPSAPELDETDDDRFMDADGEPLPHEPEFHDAPGEIARTIAEPQFHDAEGDPQKLCPVCNTMFPADLPQHMFEEHVDSHYGPVCPVCNKHFGAEHDQREFESHVHTHFEQE